MDVQRVKEILDSPANIQVLYDYHPVWIDDVDDNTETAEVRLLDKKQRVLVPVKDLIDTGKVINIDR